MERVCVFCGSAAGVRPEYGLAAEELARALVKHDLTLVYGGATVGLMGILADSVLALGGRVIGVIPEGLFSVEVPHRGLTELRVVSSMHERKREMADLSDAFVALPGGIGTLEELTEIFTWRQLGLHAKPVGLLNVAGYFTRLVEFLEHIVEEGFLGPRRLEGLWIEDDPACLVGRLAASGAQSVEPGN